MTTVELCSATAVAFALDRLLGDPHWMPHPVRAIGSAARALEPRLVRRLGRTRAAGAALTAILVGGTGMLSLGVLALAHSVSPLIEWLLATWLLYTSIAARDLDLEARGITRALRAENLPGARRALSRIVGRDTEKLEPREVVRGAVESVAESTVDGCVSPLFYALLGGPAAALAFKAANTLDSLVGHRDEHYLEFGACAARTDDVLGFLPARLARLLFPVAAWICGLRVRDCWRIAWRDGAKSPSPNAGISEAAAAGALGVRLGGTNFYDGVPEARPVLGDGDRSLETDDIPRSVRWMYATTALTLGSLGVLRLGLERVWNGAGAVALALLIGLSATDARAENALRPERIASVAVSSDEIVLSLVDPERVVAVSRYSHDEHRSHVATIARRIAPLDRPGAAALLARDPDLVLLSTRASIEVEEIVRSAGVHVERIAVPRDAEDVRRTVRRIARVVEEEEVGERLIEQFDRSLAALEHAGPTAPRALYYTPGQWTSGRDTSLDWILRHAGVRNAAAEIEGHQRVSLEWLHQQDPDILLVPSGYDRLDGWAVRLRKDPRYAQLRCVRQGWVLEVPARELMVLTHFAADAAGALRARLRTVGAIP